MLRKQYPVLELANQMPVRIWIWPEPLVAPRVRRALGTRMVVNGSVENLILNFRQTKFVVCRGNCRNGEQTKFFRKRNVHTIRRCEIYCDDFAKFIATILRRDIELDVGEYIR